MSKNILIVDSDKQSRLILEASLRKAGFTVFSASSAAEGLDIASNKEIHLIISELRLDDESGVEFCRNLRKRPSCCEIPFIFIARQEDLEGEVDALKLGVSDILVKPLYIHEIINRVETLLKRSEVERVASTVRGRDSYEGALSDTLLIDIIRSVHAKGRTGHIDLFRDTRAGSIWFRDGEIIDAKEEMLEGEEAVYRLLLWNRGRFHIHFHPVDRPNKIQKSIDELIYEGIRRLAEWNQLSAAIPELKNVKLIDILEYIDSHGVPQELGNMFDFFPRQVGGAELGEDAVSISPKEALEVLVQRTGAADKSHSKEELHQQEQSKDSESKDKVQDVSSGVDFLHKPMEEATDVWGKVAQSEDTLDFFDGPSTTDNIEPPDTFSIAEKKAGFLSALERQSDDIYNVISETTESDPFDLSDVGTRSPEALDEWNVLTPKAQLGKEKKKRRRTKSKENVFEPPDMEDQSSTPTTEFDIHSAPTVLLNDDVATAESTERAPSEPGEFEHSDELDSPKDDDAPQDTVSQELIPPTEGVDGEDFVEHHKDTAVFPGIVEKKDTAVYETPQVADEESKAEEDDSAPDVDLTPSGDTARFAEYNRGEDVEAASVAEAENDSNSSPEGEEINKSATVEDEESTRSHDDERSEEIVDDGGSDSNEDTWETNSLHQTDHIVDTQTRTDRKLTQELIVAHSKKEDSRRMLMATAALGLGAVVFFVWLFAMDKTNAPQAESSKKNGVAPMAIRDFGSGSSTASSKHPLQIQQSNTTQKVNEDSAEELRKKIELDSSRELANMPVVPIEPVDTTEQSSKVDTNSAKIAQKKNSHKAFKKKPAVGKKTKKISVGNRAPIVPQALSKPAKNVSKNSSSSPSIKTYIAKGKKFLRAGDSNRAINMFNQALEMNPDSYVANFWMGEALIRSGKISHALPYMQSATRINPNFAKAWVRLGYIYEFIGKTNEAKAAYRRFLKLSPKGRESARIRRIIKEL